MHGLRSCNDIACSLAVLNPVYQEVRRIVESLPRGLIEFGRCTVVVNEPGYAEIGDGRTMGEVIDNEPVGGATSSVVDGFLLEDLLEFIWSHPEIMRRVVAGRCSRDDFEVVKRCLAELGYFGG